MIRHELLLWVDKGQGWLAGEIYNVESSGIETVYIGYYQQDDILDHVRTEVVEKDPNQQCSANEAVTISGYLWGAGPLGSHAYILECKNLKI